MVEDAPRNQPLPQVREEPSSDYAWEEWADLMIACLIVPKTLDALIDLWKANDAMIDYVKDIHPDIYERVRTSFTKRKLQLQKDG